MLLHACCTKTLIELHIIFSAIIILSFIYRTGLLPMCFPPCIFIYQTLCIVYKCIHVHHLRLTNVNKAITYLLTYLLPLFYSIIPGYIVVSLLPERECYAADILKYEVLTNYTIFWIWIIQSVSQNCFKSAVDMVQHIITCSVYLHFLSHCPTDESRGRTWMNSVQSSSQSRKFVRSFSPHM